MSIREPVGHSSKGGFIEGRDWNLEFRMRVESPNEGFVELVGLNIDGLFDAREALVISDDDNCLEFDLGHTSSELDGPFDGTTCGDGVIEEVFIPFRTDPSDRVRVSDTDGCQPANKTRMQDDLSSEPPGTSNKAYLLAPPQDGPGVINPLRVGPVTEVLVTDDCYGYGRDEDLPGLVVMADVGAARVFDQKFDLVQVVPGSNRIRNLAGFTSTVTRELRDRFGRSHIVAHMQIERGMLEPLVVFDARTAPTAPFIGPNFLRRIDSGPVESFNWDTPPSPTTVTAAEVAQLLDTLPDVTSVKVRAVLVKGNAPEFIDDLDMDGRYTIKDLVLMGFEPLSNQAQRTINIVQQEKFEDFGGTLECPAQSVIVGVDLTGNNAGYSCQDGDGSSRSRKRPPQ